MTISTTATSIQYVRNGTTTQWSYPNKVFSAADLVVIDLDTSVPPVVTQLALNTDYTVSNVDVDSGCIVNTTIAGVAGHTLDIRSNILQSQMTSIKNQGSYLPELHEEFFDRITREIQDLTRKAYTYGIKGPDTETVAWTALPSAKARSNTGLVFDANGLPSLGLVPTGTFTQTLWDAFLASTVNLYKITAAEAAALVTPTNYQYPAGNVNRYGANSTPGTTDMTSAIQAALNQAGQTGGAPAYLPAGTYLASVQLTIASNARLTGDGASSILNFSSTANADSILGNNVSNASVQNLKLVVTGVQVAGGLYAGVVAFRGCTNCRADANEVVGAYYGGILIANSSQCRVVGNYIHGAQGTYQDSADIHVDATAAVAASFNVIDGNQCFGVTSWHGIALEASANPNAMIYKNVVTNNRVGQHAAYGIMLYTHTQGDTYNQIIGNYIENIQGTALSGAAGMGIYVAGNSGVTVANNVLYNCMVQTSVNFVPGALAILMPANGSPCTITGNSVIDTAQGNANGVPIAAILIASASLGSTVTGNTVSQQNGIISYGIQVLGGNANFSITGNIVNINNTLTGTRGIFVYANGANVQNVTISGNIVTGCSSRGISVDQTGGFTVNLLSITGNTVSGGSSASIPISVVSGVQGSVSGNSCNAVTVVALNVSASIGMSYSANVLYSSGATAVSTAGSCSGVFDESNVVNGLINNGATGLNVRTRGVAAPAGAAAAVLGDVVYNTAGVTPFAWLCTTAGTPGTWQGVTVP